MQQSGRRVEVQLRCRGRREHALVADVVDRQQGACTCEQGVPCIAGAQQLGQQAGVPVVAVHDMGANRRRWRLEDGELEQEEAQVFVHCVRVQRIARVQLRTVDEVHGDAEPGSVVACSENSTAWRPSGTMDLLRFHHGNGSSSPRRSIVRVVRHEEPHVVTPLVKVAAERTGHVGEPAGLGERCDLRSGKADLSRHESGV